MSLIGKLAYELGKGFSEGFWTAYFAERRRQTEYTRAEYDEDFTADSLSEFDHWLHPAQSAGSGNSGSTEAPQDASKSKS